MLKDLGISLYTRLSERVIGVMLKDLGIFLYTGLSERVIGIESKDLALRLLKLFSCSTQLSTKF